MSEKRLKTDSGDDIILNIAFCYFQLGNITDDNREAIEYYKLALGYLKNIDATLNDKLRMKHERIIIQSYSNLAHRYEKESEIDKARDNYELCLRFIVDDELVRKNDAFTEFAFSACERAVSFLREQKFYNVLNEYVDKCLSIFEFYFSSKHDDKLAMLYRKMGFVANTNNLERASFYFGKSLEIFQKLYEQDSDEYIVGLAMAHAVYADVLKNPEEKKHHLTIAKKYCIESLGRFGWADSRKEHSLVSYVRAETEMKSNFLCVIHAEVNVNLAKNLLTIVEEELEKLQ